MWNPTFSLKAIVTFIGSYAGRKKNFRFVIMPVVCAPVIKFTVAPGPSTGQSSLQNSNLITPAFESGTKDGGEKERQSFHLSREIWERITDPMWRRRLLVPYNHKDKLKKRCMQIRFYTASVIVFLFPDEKLDSLVPQLFVVSITLCHLFMSQFFEFRKLS